MISVSTNVHEMGHGIEYKMPGAQTAAQRFLEHRVGKEPLRNLTEVLPNHGYGDWEQGRKDDQDEAFIRKRIGWTKEKTQPVIEEYRVELDSSGEE